MSTMEKSNTPGTRRSFTPEFKADAGAMVLDEDRKIVDVAEAIDLGDRLHHRCCFLPARWDAGQPRRVLGTSSSVGSGSFEVD